MDRENVATERGEGWMHAGHGSTVVIMAMAYGQAGKRGH